VQKVVEKMKKLETPDEIRRREKRHNRRENQIGIAIRRKNEREENAVYRNITQKTLAGLLKNDNKQEKKEKRPGAEKFLNAFSFINWTPYDKRYLITPSYQCRSFNEQKQILDFFKEFIYPYKIPRILIWAALEKDTVITENGKIKPSPEASIIKNTRKWICDIVSGNSFYKQNKDYFTRAEAHFFLNSEIVYENPN